MRLVARRAVMISALLCLTAAAPVSAGFSGTDVFLASVGESAGAAGSNWSTTVWVHNPASTPATVQFLFLARDRDNTTPAGVYNDVIPAGDTRRWNDALGTMFGVTGFGALRVISDARLVVNSRIHSRGEGAELRDSIGQFFAAVPAEFAIGQGTTTRLLGAHQTSPKAESQFRYNFGFVEVSGSYARVRVAAFSGDGLVLGSKEYDLRPYEPRQFPLEDVLPGVDAENLRLEVEVLSSTGRVIAFGSSLANRSNDPSTFEMLFPDSVLAGTQGIVVDSTLTGDGSAAAPLGVADVGVERRHLAPGAAVMSVNGVTDAVTIAAGTGVTVATAGSTVTVGTSANAVCSQCSAEHIFHVAYPFKPGVSTVFTVPPGRTRYITGVHSSAECETDNYFISTFFVETQELLVVASGTPSWSSGGGAPIVVRGGQSLQVSTFIGSGCSGSLYITGFEF